MAKELRIRDEQNNLLYPVTVTDLVFNDQTGETLTEELEGKQETLESGTNIKTINNTSLLGSGNISIEGKSAYQSAVDNGFTGTEAQWLESLKGEKGETGSVTVSDGVAQITIVNDLTTGGTSDALSAEMGKRLDDKIKRVSASVFKNVEEDGFFFVDENGYIGASITQDGLKAINILTAVEIV